MFVIQVCVNWEANTSGLVQVFYAFIIYWMVRAFEIYFIVIYSSGKYTADV